MQQPYGHSSACFGLAPHLWLQLTLPHPSALSSMSSGHKPEGNKRVAECSWRQGLQRAVCSRLWPDPEGMGFFNHAACERERVTACTCLLWIKTPTIQVGVQIAFPNGPRETFVLLFPGKRICKGMEI